MAKLQELHEHDGRMPTGLVPSTEPSPIWLDPRGSGDTIWTHPLSCSVLAPTPGHSWQDRHPSRQTCQSREKQVRVDQLRGQKQMLSPPRVSASYVAWLEAPDQLLGSSVVLYQSCSVHKVKSRLKGSQE